ncbi:hypothetical protein IW01_18620 [Pectobacterium brasiliense]|uniref:hypothetical protein n=1 Tax=Pectobacterium brasiliense TaxID=180957 RepID=UPI0004E6B933|nr:hypothetical protein [Pectobacterium brasiliense]KFF65210.1 hypothetical protein IW01_18620 [Pectobacterium brasiliense]
MPRITDEVYVTRERDVNLLRRHSFSLGDGHKINKEIKKINNSSPNLKRSKAVHNLALPDKNHIPMNLVKIEYQDRKAKDISAKDFIYCGSATTLPINNLGMSIDNDGHLILINGQSYDFFKGFFRKKTTGYNYKTSRLTNNYCDKKFKEIYLNNNGEVIGNEKNTGKNYIIKLHLVETNTESSEQFIKIDFIDCLERDNHDNLTFKIDENTLASYFTKDNKLYLKSIKKEWSENDYSCFFYEIKIPLKAGYSTASIKKSMNSLQIGVENKNKNKNKIYFIEPKNISNRKFSVKKLSHKPPQSFSSRVGNDPHEKYHAGFPFTSDRKANFSSRTIPLFSSVVDNFKFNIKKSKQNSLEGKNGKAIINVAKAIDPGVKGICTSISQACKSTSKRIGNNISNKEELYDKNINILASREKPLSKLVNSALGVDSEKNLSEKLISLLDEINIRDTLHLTSTNRIAVFFGIASGGFPFVPGWFAGIVAELSNRQNLTISKTETGNIRLSFNNQSKVAATGLAGTGQGMERNLLEAGPLNYMTVLPLEANAIIVTQYISGNNFSFDMSKEHFKEFSEQFSNPQEGTLLREIIITEAEAEKIKEKALIIKIETKSELRLQAGCMVNPNVYMVMPRTAVGVRLAVDLLNIKSSISESADENTFSSKKEHLKITTLGREADFFYEQKIMPIVMHGGGDNILWCYPLPLLEETYPLNQYTNEKHLTIFEKKTNHPSTSELTNKTISYNLNDVKKIPLYITLYDKKGIKIGPRIERLAKVDINIKLVNDTLTQLKKSLINQQRDSQNKSCFINVIVHYEIITSPPVTTSSFQSDTAENKSYRLKKLEIRRSSSLQHKYATIPMPILNFSNTHSITYDQFLGEIELEYKTKNDLSLININRKLSVLY